MPDSDRLPGSVSQILACRAARLYAGDRGLLGLRFLIPLYVLQRVTSSAGCG